MAKTELTMEDFHTACQNIVDDRLSKSLNYAVEYAAYGKRIVAKHEAYVQALYILNNITRWRGDKAKETRAILKRVDKEWKNE